MIRVVGLGSPFGDDRVGWRVIELLREKVSGDIDLIALDRPGATLINWMQGVHWLILIDALSSGAAPGSVLKLTPTDLETANTRLTSHDLALPDTLRLAKSLGCLPARIDIYGVELLDCQSPELSQAVVTAATKLASLISAQLGG